MIGVHIPFFEEGARGFRPADRERLFALLRGFPHVLLLSGHTHTQRHWYHDAATGWHGTQPLHEYNVGAACGAYWSGVKDAAGIPDSTMADGTPNGHARLRVQKGGEYTLSWHAARAKDDSGIGLHAPKVLRRGAYPAWGVYANVHMGEADTRVEYRVDGGEWKAMKRVEQPDPSLLVENMRDDLADALRGYDRSPEAEIEVIELTTRFYQNIGLTDTVVLLNSIGDTDTRARFGARVLEQVAPWLATLPPEDQERVRKNPMRLLDSKDPAVQDLVSGLPPIHTFLSDAGQAHFAAVQAGLTERGIAFRIDPTVVRGLDYYNDCVFEIHSQFLGAQGALCGGGRYDGLMKQLGGPNIPCVGVGMGVERALIVLEQVKGLPAREPLTAFVIAFGEPAQVAARSLVATLRAEGIPAQCALGFGSPKQQFKQADQSGARFAIIIGEDELASGTLSLKNLANAEQQTLPAGEIVHTLKK